MGKFNYTTNIIGHRSTSIRRAIYRRSSPKDCCNRPQYRMLRPTPTPRPPTPTPPAPTPVLISCGDTFIGSNRRCNTPSVHGGNCADYYEFNENEGAYYNCEKDKYDVTLGQYRCRSGKKCSACKSDCCKADCAIKWPNCVNNADPRDNCCEDFLTTADSCKGCIDRTKCKSNSVPIIESSDNVSSKLKILCLHGGGQSVASFRVLLTDLINELSEFEFVFAETPEENYVWIRDPPGGKDEPTTDPDWALNSIDYLDEFVRKQGPFYGILGYSQGGVMALTYLAYLQETNKDKELSFKKIILFNGYLPTTHQGLVSSINNLVIDAPILIIVGEKDYYFNELGKILYNQLDKNNTIKLIIDELLGHYPPGLEHSSFEEVVYFIKN